MNATNGSQYETMSANSSANELDSNELKQFIADYLKKEHTFDSTTELILKCFYISLIVSGIVTNSVVIFVIASNRRLKTSNNLLLINLLVSDILLCLFCMPFTLVAIIRRSWPFGALICKSVPFIQAVTTFVSSQTIPAIAIDRMIQIKRNQFSAKRVLSRSPSPKQFKYIYCTLIIWIISVLLSAPIAAYQSVVEFGIKDLVFYDKCVENWPNNNRGIYSFVILITQLLIPSSVMVFAHFRIRRHLNKYSLHKAKRNMISMERNVNNNECFDQTIQSNITNNNHIQRNLDTVEDMSTSTAMAYSCCLSSICETNDFDKELNRNNRITIFLLTLTILYAISWLPWNLFNVLVDFYPDISLTTSDLYIILAVCHLIAMSSATTNAIFYGFLHTAIRLELSKNMNKIKKYFTD